MLEGAVFDESAVWDVRIVIDHAVGKAEVELRFRVEVGSAEENDISETFGGAVHTGYGVRVRVDAKSGVSLVILRRVEGFGGCSAGD